METRPSDNELDELLSRGSMGATRRDAVLEDVLARVKSERAGIRRRRWFWAALGATATTAAAVLLSVPRWSQPNATAFRAKGTQPPLVAAGPSLECVGARLAACPVDSFLVVRVSGAKGFISAWAEPIKDSERIWYFSADSFSPWVDGTVAADAVTPRAARVGAEHAPGTYVVQMRLTAKPMGRAELLRESASSALASAQALLTVVGP